MMGQTATTKVVVTNPQGFHMRPAAAFARQALQFQGQVYVTKDDQRVDGKSPLALLSLFAPPGTELTIEVTGEDPGVVLSTLAEIVNTTFDESA